VANGSSCVPTRHDVGPEGAPAARFLGGRPLDHQRGEQRIRFGGTESFSALGPSSLSIDDRPETVNVPTNSNEPPEESPRSAAPAHSPDAFDPKTLDKAIIALPLLAEMDKLKAEGKPHEPIDIIIDVDLGFSPRRSATREAVRALVKETIGEGPGRLYEAKNEFSEQYVFASLTADQIRQLASSQLPKKRPDGTKPRSKKRVIYKIWLDHKTGYRTNRSISTVKADAARSAFRALGEKIVWAVLDTGVDGNHPHFQGHETLKLDAPLQHRDFSSEAEIAAGTDETRNSALIDLAGHGTHVAGIISGEFEAGPADRLLGGVKQERAGRISSTTRHFNADGSPDEDVEVSDTGAMSGMAPLTKILSLKVLDKDGGGNVSNILAALEYIQQLNSYGRNILVHGVNLSVGYSFEPAWFACGQSPICVEVNRLVRSGVVVVVAAGNTGYGYNQTVGSGPKAAGLDITINDPGNADLAITVGSTHREMPHVYGVSYFSSKGPTGDGRLKPDLLAPGEKIVSCASGDVPDTPQPPADGPVVARYVEDSGTSMAAPHVSGVIAAFLSIRREFIGQPERVKEIFLGTATDLGRAVYFQGRGLVDLMRAIQSV
jgi:serine protease AprX